jgi:3-phenylpropionate/trans-cinnamate dioxygenase ferredoxin component
MADFVEAARLEQVAPGESLFVYVGETGVALFNIDGTIYAINDTCVHQGSSLAHGRLNGKIVTCRAHGMKYDVTTEQVTTGGFGVASYPAKVVDGRILIALE